MPDHAKTLAQIAHDAANYRAAESALDTARQKLARRILAALADGVRQADILRATDHVWTREYLRQLAQKEQQS